MTAQKTFNKTQIKSMISGYTNKNMSLAALASKFGTSISTVRRVLTQNGVTIRPRGRIAGVSPAKA